MAIYGEETGELYQWYVEDCERQQDAIEAGGPRSDHRSLRDPFDVEVIEEPLTWTLEEQRQGYAEWKSAFGALLASVRAQKAQS